MSEAAVLQTMAASDLSDLTGAERRPSRAVRASGCVQELPKGTMLFSHGDRAVDFFLVLEGNIEIHDDGPDGAPNVFTIHGPSQFTGELDLFNDRDILAGGRMGANGRVVRMSRPGSAAC